ncbi:MAG TPA: hypothetical protein VLU38_04765 [Methanomassiliicoccales archaeon]|nr:hypothetical protein [Methanomassiliicoccales archaeon]
MDDEVIDWLLEEVDPSVRYLALRDLLGKGEGDEEVLEAKARIMEEGPVPRILAQQKPEGNWGEPEDFYRNSKYKGTVWNLILLAELYADPEDQRVRAACEFVLRWSQERSSGGFSVNGDERKGGAKASVICCLTSNMAFSLIRLGYGEDPRVRKALEWLTTYQRYEHASKAPKEWPYLYNRCWRDHSCRSGAVKSLKALAEVPVPRRTGEMDMAIEEGAEFLLSQHIFRKGPGSKAVSRPEWLRLGFPLMWNTDILEILGILTQLGYQDERMHDALTVLISKRGADGRWVQENRFEGRFIVPMGRNGKPSKWVTLRALRVLEAMPR